MHRFARKPSTIHSTRSNKQKNYVSRCPVDLRLLQPGWVTMALSALAGAQPDRTAEDRRGHPDEPKVYRWVICGVHNYVVRTYNAKIDCRLHLVSNWALCKNNYSLPAHGEAQSFLLREELCGEVLPIGIWRYARRTHFPEQKMSLSLQETETKHQNTENMACRS